MPATDLGYVSDSRNINMPKIRVTGNIDGTQDSIGSWDMGNMLIKNCWNKNKLCKHNKSEINH